MTKAKKHLLKLILSAMFIGIGLILPLFTGQIKQIGNMLLPMHIPVLLCGLVCGWQYGATVGFVLPIMRSVMFSMPVMYPSAVAMAFELSAYGIVIGLVYSFMKQNSILSVYISLICAMLSGRVVWGVVMCFLLGLGTDGFTFTAFITSSFVNAIPGIILQLILIPTVMFLLHKTKLIPFDK